MKNLKITRSVIPNLVTSLNMLCGFASIVYSNEGRFFEASILIFLAAMFDTLDGIMARLTKSSSQFGVELDSLSDLVSFGVAPAFLIYKSYLFQFEITGILISSLLMIFGGYRLARFNVQLVGFSKEYFTGLPIPASAITLASFVLTFYNDGYSERIALVIIPLVICLSLLMVSKIKYDTLPKLNVKIIKEKPLYFGFLFLSFIAIFITVGKAIFFVFLLFILFGILRQIVTLTTKKS